MDRIDIPVTEVALAVGVSLFMFIFLTGNAVQLSGRTVRWWPIQGRAWVSRDFQSGRGARVAAAVNWILGGGTQVLLAIILLSTPVAVAGAALILAEFVLAFAWLVALLRSG